MATSFLLEESEMHTSVCPLFYEMWVLVEVVRFGVFQYKIATFFKYSLFKNQIGDSGQCLQIVWRVCVNEIILHMARLNELEHITPNQVHVLYTQLFATGYDEVLLRVRHFYGGYFARAT